MTRYDWDSKSSCSSTNSPLVRKIGSQNQSMGKTCSFFWRQRVMTALPHNASRRVMSHTWTSHVTHAAPQWKERTPFGAKEQRQLFRLTSRTSASIDAAWRACLSPPSPPLLPLFFYLPMYRMQLAHIPPLPPSPFCRSMYVYVCVCVHRERELCWCRENALPAMLLVVVCCDVLQCVAV